jgi:DNA-binding NarL/FixJ family response regulator
VPVVVLTSSEDPSHEGRSMDLGAQAFYRKPTDLDGLGETVRSIVDEHLGNGLRAGALPLAM